MYIQYASDGTHFACVQVIMPNTACDGANVTRLYKMIGDQFPTSNLVTVQRKYFNETKGEPRYMGVQ